MKNGMHRAEAEIQKYFIIGSWGTRRRRSTAGEGPGRKVHRGLLCQQDSTVWMGVEWSVQLPLQVLEVSVMSSLWFPGKGVLL